MNAEFNWWLLIVGVVGGAGLLWLVLGDWSRREEEVGERERAREAAWIADVLHADGATVDAATAEAVLRLHRTWLRETAAYDPLDDEITDEPADTPGDEPVDERIDAATPSVSPTDEALDLEPARIGAGDEPGDEPRAGAGRPVRSGPLPDE